MLNNKRQKAGGHPLCKTSKKRIEEFFNYNFFLKNRKGADKIITIYWFAILLLVAAGVISMVLAFQTPYDVRELEASLLTDHIADYLAPQGVLDSEIVKKLKSGETIGTTCSDQKSCQKIIGSKIIEIVGAMKSELGITDVDGLVRNQGVAENFECFVAQVAMHESVLQHCGNLHENGNPIYCEGEKAKTIQSGDTDPQGNSLSWGVMQIYKSKHPTSTPENFEDSIKYGANLLAGNYNAEEKYYGCKTESYLGWKRALRYYNGWNTNCNKGDVNYVDNVIGLKDDIQELFPSQCSSSLTDGIKISEEANLNIDNGQYYFEVYFNNFTSGKSLNSVKEGNGNLLADCKAQDVKEHKKLSKCFERSFYAVDGKNNPYSIKILTAVRKTEKNVA